MSIITLGIGDYAATRTPGAALKTLALGSCVAVIIMHPTTHTIAMAHVALPDSSIRPDLAKKQPGHFADTAIKGLLGLMNEQARAILDRKMIIKLVGGAQIADPHNTFNIGKKNLLALRKAIHDQGMEIKSEDVGGDISRTVMVDVDHGKVVISSPGKKDWEI